MRFLGGSTETAIRLVGQLGQDARGFVYGVAFVDDKEDFSELNFASPPTWNVEVDGPMQCESYKRYEVVDQSQVQADVYALSVSILRYCVYCGTRRCGGGRRMGSRIPRLSCERLRDSCGELSADPYTSTRSTDG